MAIVPLQIKFLHMRRMASLERDITERVQDLQSVHGRIIGCHVSVEVPHHSHQTGNNVEVRISVPNAAGWSESMSISPSTCSPSPVK
jgi:hypothetical protein